MTYLSIGEVASQMGVQPSTLRYYETLGLLAPAARRGGKRHYAPEVLERLRIIQVAKEAGFTLAEIRTLLDGFSTTEPPSALWLEMARQKIAEVDALIARAQSMKALLLQGLDCECLRLDECAMLLGTGNGEI